MDEIDLKQMTDDELFDLEDYVNAEIVFSLEGLNDPISNNRRLSALFLRQHIEKECKRRRPKHYSDLIASHALAAFEANDNNASKAAKDLGISRDVLTKLVCEALDKPYKNGDQTYYPIKRDPEEVRRLMTLKPTLRDDFVEHFTQKINDTKKQFNQANKTMYLNTDKNCGS